MRQLTDGEREVLAEQNRDAGPPDWRELRSATQTAKKEHTCSACGRPIMKGARYELIVGTEDGQLCQERFHRACVNGPWDNEPQQAEDAAEDPEPYWMTDAAMVAGDLAFDAAREDQFFGRSHSRD